MQDTRARLLGLLWLASASGVQAGVHYVNVNSTNATPPYTTWATSATNIQDAVDASVVGDEILVTNGIYPTYILNVYKPVSLRSVNGPQFTTILGRGSVNLTNGANLSGFGVSGAPLACESASAVVSNCVIFGISYAGTFYGRVSGGTLNNCTLTHNATQLGGRVAYGCSLNNCSLTANPAYDGVVAYGCSLNNCTLTGNSAYTVAASCSLTNCILCFNTGPNYDSSCTLDHCCTSPLPSTGAGNISADPKLTSTYYLSALSPCIGKGNYATISGTDIDGEPWANPPAIGCDEYHAGNVTGPLSVGLTASYTNVSVGFPVVFTALIEGHPDLNAWIFGDGGLEINEPLVTHSWTTPGDYIVSLWCFNDSYPGSISANLTVHVALDLHYVAANSTNPVPPYTSWATAAANVQDAVDAATTPGALVLVTNGIYATGSRGTFGNTSGNRVVVNKLVTVQSVNGPQFTIIDGGHSNRCASLNGVLSGFTLTNGFGPNGGAVSGGTLSNCTLSGNSASGDGGGAYDCALNNCTLTGNSALDYGGGATFCTLNNCVLTGNWARSGGGAAFCTLNNGTVTGNSAGDGGGAYDCALNNSIIYFNGAQYRADYVFHDPGNINYCCTTPLPTDGVGNITGAPLFVDINGWANLRLQSNSPCINAGNNSYLSNSYFTNCFDLDGNPRSQGGTVDIGAYEFQSPTSRISYAWLQQYGLSTDGSADFADPDRDGLNNWQEWRCGTDPTNALSSLRMLAQAPKGTNVTVTWQSVYGINYFVERSSSSAPSAFTPLATHIPGQQGTTSFTDAETSGDGPRFYRVGVSDQ